jgi:hypothetical protein
MGNTFPRACSRFPFLVQTILRLLKVRSKPCEPYNALFSFHRSKRYSPRSILPGERLPAVPPTVTKEYRVGMRGICLTLDFKADRALCGKGDLPFSAWVRSIRNVRAEALLIWDDPWLSLHSYERNPRGFCLIVLTDRETPTRRPLVKFNEKKASKCGQPLQVPDHALGRFLLAALAIPHPLYRHNRERRKDHCEKPTRNNATRYAGSHSGGHKIFEQRQADCT